MSEQSEPDRTASVLDELFAAGARPRYLVTVDTEEEFDWDKPFQRDDHTTVSVPKLARFQEFIGKYRAKPVYFADYSIVSDEAAAAFLKAEVAAGTATVGAHLHPWVNPPFEEEVSDRNSFAGNLPRELERAKLEQLTALMTETIGQRPSMYRAGRYGIGANTVSILDELDLVIDSSIRPHFDYSDEGGPNFAGASSRPHWHEGYRVLELPLTVVFTGLLRPMGPGLSRLTGSSSLAESVLSKTGMVSRIPLTPEGIGAREATEAIDMALDDGLPLLVFSFHSPSLSAGHTPYVQTDADLDNLYDWWRAILDHLGERGVAPLDADELVAAVQAKRAAR